ncbi:ABC transporter substrate-binding protein [Aliihoeflea aestuarii]|jgi:iron complex transport system substrate-binding protein|uniref:siderophore ABC transporter substrate-binding protein n=1 Tax=Aliihoeflea aestuarii TaxID=453840 RepID=UPI0020920EB0|nr:ABC transporter substrate-binding protein [Aliihoeflea aestuarii]MCO6390130.1 ABC transporter substrate-binding protein [Aliihoeflea aestuarii]
MPQTLAGIASLVAALAFAPAALGQTFDIEHRQGTTAIEAVPETVMVTDWAAFDNLDAMGIDVSGVPSTAMPPYLSDKLPVDVQTIGSLQEPDIEGIVASEPDLVILAARSRTAYPTLSGFVPTIDLSVDNENLIDGVKANLTTLGEIFDRQDRADDLIAALDAKVGQARAAADGKGTGLVIVTNAGNLGVYGPGSRIAWIYDALNVPSVFDDVDDRDHGGDAISFEYLLETNPDWLFVVDRDAGIGSEGAARALLDNELIHETNFWQNDRIVYLDPAAAYVTMHGYSGLMLLLDQVIEGYGRDS